MIPRTSAESAQANAHIFVEEPPSGPHPATEDGGERILSDVVLLRICRVSRNDPQLTPEWISELRLAARLVGDLPVRQEVGLRAAVTLLASTLGKLTQFNPRHLPFGYHGPQVRSRDWIERQALERVGKQIVGLTRQDSAPEAVASAVSRAVSESVRLGFLEQREYDAWRPGMRSGTGWRVIVSATPYGVTKAQHFAEVYQAGEARQAAGQGAAAAARQWTKEAYRVVPWSSEPAREATAADLPSRPVDSPAVQIGRPGEPCIVLGKQKKPLTDGQYAVISALLQAGEDGLTKDGVEAVRPGARQILRRLKQDEEWDKVVLMPGQTNGRYRVRA